MKRMIFAALMAIGLMGCATTKAPPPASPTAPHNCDITIAADHTIALNGRTVQLAALSSALIAEDPTKRSPVKICVDRHLSFSIVVQVLDQVKAAGFTLISVAPK